METPRSIILRTLSCWLFAFAIVIAPGAVRAATWQATAGAERTDHGIQALAFLPNGLWIHVGDSITWTFPTPEIHTVTFLEQDTNSDRLARVWAHKGAVPIRQECQTRRPVAPPSMAPLV
jgi:plastocyanin